MLSRLLVDFPITISGNPTCLSSFLQPIPVTFYFPGLLNWLTHGWLVNIIALRVVGLFLGFLWVAGLAVYLDAKSADSLGQEAVSLSPVRRRLNTAGFVLSVFSIGVFPFFLISNRNEQLMLPFVVLLLAVSILSGQADSKGLWYKAGLAGLYFTAVSLIVYGHAKGLLLTPFFAVVGWQLFRKFGKLALLFAALLLGLHLAQAYLAWKADFQCGDAPVMDALMKSFTFDPLSLFSAPGSFFNQAYHSLAQAGKYLDQLSFQTLTDISYLPDLPLGRAEKFANILIKLNAAAVFFSLLFFLPFQYCRRDIAERRFVTVNLALLVLFACAFFSAVFNLPKNWYDAGYMYALLLIMLVFFIGENFAGILHAAPARRLLCYLGVAALMSQGVFIHRYLPEFLDGFSGPGVSIAKYDSRKTSDNLAAACAACGIDPVNSQRLVVDDYTYLYLRKTRYPMPISYIGVGLGWDVMEMRKFISKVNSDGLVALCNSGMLPYTQFVKVPGDFCCISKKDLKIMATLP